MFEANCAASSARSSSRSSDGFATARAGEHPRATLEVVHLGGLIAAELEAGVKTTKRAALLHDVGKADHHEVEGSARAYLSAAGAAVAASPKGSSHAIEAHHYEVQPQTVEAVLYVIAADAISASRPGRAWSIRSRARCGTSTSDGRNREAGRRQGVRATRTADPRPS